jgi:4-amino-4-deoxy-L-arabinose transferase-like glycosyltransferase
MKAMLRSAADRAWFLPTVAATLLLFGAAVRGVDHDESQYVAAVALMRGGGLPFRDFLYLQTPLQPLLLAPLGWFGTVPLFGVLRAVNAFAGVVAVVAVAQASREAGGTRATAVAAALLMLASDPLLFASSVSRNDALPMAFEAIGLWLLLRAWRRADEGARWCTFGAGLAFAAAASVKISYAIPAAVAGLGVVVGWRRLGIRAVAAFVGGGLAGILPSLAFAILYPEAFRFGVFDYSLLAPPEWRELNGQKTIFSPEARLVRFLKFFVLGPGPVALALVAVRRWRAPREAGAAALLDALIVAGIVAAVLPQPTFRQYLVPILPPLFARLGIVRIEARSRAWPALLAMGVVLGLFTTAKYAVRASRKGLPPVTVARDAYWIGDRTRGPVATLSPDRVAGGGAAIDPRFAAGPFVFRTDRLLNPAQEERFHVVTMRRLDTAFTATPPAAIVTGGEAKPSRAAPQGLDAPLAAWAIAHGYHAERSPSARITLYLKH